MGSYNLRTTDDQQEMLIEVNEDDEIVGPVARIECHNQTRNPWHRSTHIYLFNENGELYLTQRSLKKDTAAGLWTVSAGGHVQWGSTPQKTAVKELSEELHIRADLKLVDKISIDYKTEREIISIFLGSTSDIPNINEEEVSQIQSFPLEEIINKFELGAFRLSGGSNHTFRHLIDTGVLVKYRNSIYNKNGGR